MTLYPPPLMSEAVRDALAGGPHLWNGRFLLWLFDRWVIPVAGQSHVEWMVNEAMEFTAARIKDADIDHMPMVEGWSAHEYGVDTFLTELDTALMDVCVYMVIGVPFKCVAAILDGYRGSRLDWRAVDASVLEWFVRERQSDC